MPEPGWYDDPQDQNGLRWWDGARWTDRRQPRDAVSAPPPPPPPPPPASGSYGIPLGDGAGASSNAWDSAPSGGAGGGWAASGSAFGSVATGAAPPRTFWDAIKVCLTKYVDGKGRASRSEFWYFALFTLLLDLATGGFAAILTVLPSITVNVRRLHDIGKSAWALLWVLLPIIGWIVLFVYAVRPGEPSANLYG